MWAAFIVVVIVVWAVTIYRGLVSGRVHADGAWADLGVQLTHRDELILRLIGMVNASTVEEQRVLRHVADARSRAMAATSPKDQETAEAALSDALKSLFVIAEHDPQLRANGNVTDLQQSLVRVADALQGARRYYNAVVRDYNTKLMMLPDRLIARARGFKPRDLFPLNCIGEIS